MTWGAWGHKLYAFVAPEAVADFLDLVAPHLIEGVNELYMLNRLQYNVTGQTHMTEDYMYAAVNTPIQSASVDALRTVFDSLDMEYYLLSAETGLLEHTSTGATIGQAITFGQAVTALNLTAASQLTQLQTLSTVYDAEPVVNDITSGGNGQTQIVVSTLADSGIGSLRDALTRAYPRHVTFAPGLHGTIHLQSDIRATADLTLDARNHGVCVAGGALEISDETIIVNVRMRNGVVNYAGQNYIDCLSVNGDNVYMKNCSLTHGADSNLEILGTNVYLEECLIAQNMEQYNTKGVNITQGGGNVTLYRCVIAFVGDRTPTMFSGMRVDMLNCLIVNCGVPAHVQPRDSETKLNLINNRVVKGNQSGGTTALIVRTVNNPSEPNVPAYVAASGLYMAGNVNVSVPGATQAEMREMTNDGTNVAIVDTPYTALHVDLGGLIAADAAMETDVLAAAGAFPRDAIDQQIIDDIANRAAVLFPDTLDYPDLTTLFD